MGKFRRRQYSSSSEGIAPCDSPVSSGWKLSTVAESPVVTSVGNAGVGVMSMVLSGKLYLKLILAGVKAFSSCSTRLPLSAAPDSLSMRISPVKSEDFSVSSSEETSDSPEVESAWKTCARKTEMGSTGRIATSARAGGREVSKETG